MTHELLTIGRISVDIYPNDIGVDLEDVHVLRQVPRRLPVQRCRRRRPPRPPHRASSPAPATTPSARTCTANCASSAWTTPSSPRCKEWPTAVTFCAIKPPDDFPLYFYGRFPTAPDLQIKAEELDLDAIRDARHLLVHRHRPVPGAQPRGAPQGPRGPAPHRAEGRPVHHPGPRLPAHVLGLRGGSPRRRSPRSCRTSPSRSATTRNAPSPSARAPRTNRPTGCWPPASKSPSSSSAPKASWPRPAPNAWSPPRCRWRPSTASAPATPSAGPSATACCPAGRWPRS